MNTAERRREILILLQNADTPIAARTLASRFGVSRAGDRTGSGSNKGVHPGYSFHHQRLCNAAGCKLYKRI